MCVHIVQYIGGRAVCYVISCSENGAKPWCGLK
jgi:hypothetical protein